MKKLTLLFFFVLLASVGFAQDKSVLSKRAIHGIGYFRLGDSFDDFFKVSTKSYTVNTKLIKNTDGDPKLYYNFIEVDGHEFKNAILKFAKGLSFLEGITLVDTFYEEEKDLAYALFNNLANKYERKYGRDEEAPRTVDKKSDKITYAWLGKDKVLLLLILTHDRDKMEYSVGITVTDETEYYEEVYEKQ